MQGIQLHCMLKHLTTKAKTPLKTETRRKKSLQTLAQGLTTTAKTSLSCFHLNQLMLEL